MRFLLIIAFVSIAFVGCKKATEITENNQPQSTEMKTKPEESVLVITEETAEEATNEAEQQAVEITKKASTPKTIREKEPKPSGKQPKIQFNQKTFNYGMIEQGDKVQHQFTFTNTGTSDLIIKDAQASCGCTTPTYPFVPIKPGETGAINVTFSSVGKMGTQRPTITVTSNAYPKVTTLHLEGFVTDKLARNENFDPNNEENVSKGGEIIKKEEPVIEEDNR